TRKDAVGIRTINDNFIDIFPNPAQEKLNIVTDEGIETVALISLTGAFIQSLNINKEQAINVSSISKGVYLLQINTKDGSYFEKIVID
ncbi:MAG: T9SS type A sorting domain-containing protein, partial [Chitinophagales bacterium]